MRVYMLFKGKYKNIVFIFFLFAISFYLFRIYSKYKYNQFLNDFSVEYQIGQRLIQDYSNNPCIAPVLLAHATDALSKQHYGQCQELLVQLTSGFPQTSSAEQAREILTRLEHSPIEN